MVTGRDVAARPPASSPGRPAGPPGRTHRGRVGLRPDPEPIAPPIPDFADLPAHAAVAALRTLDDPRDVAATLEFEQAHGNRPGVVAAARLRARPSARADACPRVRYGRMTNQV